MMKDREAELVSAAEGSAHRDIHNALADYSDTPAAVMDETESHADLDAVDDRVVWLYIAIKMEIRRYWEGGDADL